MSEEHSNQALGHLEELSYDDCLIRLRSATVGRIAVVVDEALIVLPVNFRLVEDVGRTWIVLRTREGNVIDRGALVVAFEIDEIDERSHQGWSVVVRGTLAHVDPEAAGFREQHEPGTWLAGRDSWLVVEPFAVTGRRLVAAEQGWAFDDRGYV